MKFADVKNDITFRKIFGNAKKSICLISFLNVVLEFEGESRIKSVTFINPYLLPRLSEEKSSIIDVRATDHKGRRFIIEMQIANKKGFRQRVQYYATRDYSMQINSGEDYPKLRPTYFIGIVNFSISKGKNYVSKHLTIEEETGDNILKDVKYAFVQLTKFNKKENQLLTLTDKWTYFIKNAKNLKVIPDYVDDEGLKTAFQEADRYNWKKEEPIAYDNIKIREQDEIGQLEFAREEGREKGKAEGKAEAEAKAEQQKEQIILNLHSNGVPSAVIAISAQKTEEEVLRIIEKHENKS